MVPERAGGSQIDRTFIACSEQSSACGRLPGGSRPFAQHESHGVEQVDRRAHAAGPVEGGSMKSRDPLKLEEDQRQRHDLPGTIEVLD